jgi:L-serine deaminase
MKDELPSGSKRRSLDERFESRPQVYARLQSIADMMDEAMAEGCTADEAEALAIEQIQKLGGDVLNDWAEERHEQSVKRAQQDHPQAIKHAKKK